MWSFKSSLILLGVPVSESAMTFNGLHVWMFLCTWVHERAHFNVMCNIRSFMNFLIPAWVSFHHPLHYKVFLSSVKPIFPYSSALPTDVGKTPMRWLVCWKLGLCFISVSVLSLCCRTWAACVFLSSVLWEARLPGNGLFILWERERISLK